MRAAEMSSIDSTLQVKRLGRLLENARSLIDLLDDAEEKRGGDYILDRQYVISLIDRTVEGLGALVFDAHVLIPGSGADLFSSHDAFRGQASGMQGRILRGQKDGGEDDEPFEYLMLDEYLDWMRGEGSGESVREFVGRVVDQVFDVIGADLAEDRLAGLPDLDVQGTSARIHILDLGGALDIQGTGSLESTAIRCRPLRLILLGGADSGDRKGEQEQVSRWLALASGEHLSLRGPAGRPEVFVEASLPGHGAPGLVLVYWRAPGGEADRDVPPGFRRETTPKGLVIWRLHEHDLDMDESLSTLSRTFFS